MPGTHVSIFISYARKDSSFVDRLEADLQARSFHTWVDRRKLEGGQDWLDKIQQAIEHCDVLLVVLSPSAVASEFVRMEYRHARRKGKLVIPLVYQPCKEVPMDLNHIQWLDFQTAYEKGLNDLLIALSNVKDKISAVPNLSSPPLKTSMPPLPMKDDDKSDFVAPQPASPQPSPELDDLYRAGVVAKAAGDLERAYVFWQQILERDPHFKNGTLAPWVQTLEEKLHPVHVERLRTRADEAHANGEWGQAIGAWEALLALEPKDWQAKENVKIARHNQNYAYLYENAVRFLDKDGDIFAAREQLKMLWHDAPWYGDPLELSQNVKLRAPSNYWRKKEKNERKRFIKAIGTSSFWLTVQTLCLLTGTGLTTGILTQFLPFSVGAVVFMALLIYLLGYRRAVSPVAMSIYVAISSIITFIIIFYMLFIISFITEPTIDRKEICADSSFMIFATMIYSSLFNIYRNTHILDKIVNNKIVFLSSMMISCVILLGIENWWMNGLFQLQFNNSIAMHLIARGVGAIDGVGLEALLVIWWNALITYRNKQA